VRNTIRAEVEQHGYNRALGSYVATLGGDEIDASLLLLGLYRYVDPADPRMMSTCRRIHQRLERRSLIYRYLDTDDGLTKGEGAFGIAGFWGVECRALGGDLDGARRAFEQLCGYANDVGLLSEEYNPDSGEALGNFPQAFSHVGLINAASTLAACARGQHPEADVEAQQPMAEEKV
jgi:GH15 family glucan-1,4-alpha-glucosidase